MNENDQIPDAEVVNPTTAVARREDTPPPTKPESVTPAQAKVNAIAELTMSAYARASELKLTPEESAALQAPFPDEAFKPGAAGKENLIYIEHAFLRERLNQVFGLGQWAIVPRNRWNEDFTIPARNGQPAVEASRIYVEAMLVVRGCFVAEAVGDMVYYKNNQSQNYGDAVEGAKTAALRRCTKEMGIGLQAWQKDWCNGWWARKNAKGRSGGSQGSGPAPAARPAPASASRPAATASQVLPKPAVEATEDQKARFLALFPGINGDYALRFFQSKGWVPNSPDAKLTDLPLKYVPTSKKVAEDLVAQVEATVTAPAAGADEEWKNFIFPWGKDKDTRLGDMDKKRLYGFVMNYEVEEQYNGQPKAPEAIAKDRELRQMLNMAGVHYGWIKSEEIGEDPF